MKKQENRVVKTLQNMLEDIEKTASDAESRLSALVAPNYVSPKDATPQVGLKELDVVFEAWVRDDVMSVQRYKPSVIGEGDDEHLNDGDVEIFVFKVKGMRHATA